MYNAKLILDLGKDAEDTYKVLDKKPKFKRSTVKFGRSKYTLIIQIQAQDKVALLSSINSVLKQLRIVSNTQTLFED